MLAGRDGSNRRPGTFSVHAMCHRSGVADPLSLSPVEDYTASAVEGTVGGAWGQRTVRDARDASGLRVDLTYDDARVALELTSLNDSEWSAASSEVVKLETRLTERARRDGWGGWVLGIAMPARLRELETEVARLMETGDEFEPSYSSDALLAMVPEAVEAFLDRHRSLRRLGLSMLRKRASHDTVQVLLAGAGFRIEGFSSDLQDIVDRKASTLREARPYQTHLAVLVVRWDFSDASEETRPPVLPADIDVLWVVHPARGEEPVRLWRLDRGAQRWCTQSVRN